MWTEARSGVGEMATFKIKEGGQDGYTMEVNSALVASGGSHTGHAVVRVDGMFEVDAT